MNVLFIVARPDPFASQISCKARMDGQIQKHEVVGASQWQLALRCSWGLTRLQVSTMSCALRNVKKLDHFVTAMVLFAAKHHQRPSESSDVFEHSAAPRFGGVRLHQLWSVVQALRDSAESPCGGILRVILRRLQDLCEEEDIFEAQGQPPAWLTEGPTVAASCWSGHVVWLASSWVAEVGQHSRFWCPTLCQI